MKYFTKWIEGLSLAFEINPKLLRVVVLFFCFWKKPKEFSLSIAIPKYALILTDSKRYFYENGNYRFFKKKIWDNTYFYIMHVVGNTPTEIEGKDCRWDAE